MSTVTHVEAFDSPASEIVEPPRRQTAGDPLVLGLPLIAVGAFALGLQLVGFVNVSSNGSPLAVLIGASGLGLLLSTAWAASLRFTPLSSVWAAGTSLPTTVLGSLAAFFLSYATLVLGLAHGWLRVSPSDIQHTVALFQISWLAGFLLLAWQACGCQRRSRRCSCRSRSPWRCCSWTRSDRQRRLGSSRGSSCY
jgi:uncharacterized protein